MAAVEPRRLCGNWHVSSTSDLLRVLSPSSWLSNTDVEAGVNIYIAFMMTVYVLLRISDCYVQQAGQCIKTELRDRSPMYVVPVALLALGFIP